VDQIGAKKLVGPHDERATVNEMLDALVTDLEIRMKLSPQVLSKMKPVRAALGRIFAMQVSDHLIREYIRVRLKGAVLVSSSVAGMDLKL
jgi:hypothetical protein